MRATISTTKSKVRASSPGQMEENTTESGRTVSSTASESTTQAKVKSKRESGQKESVSSGSITEHPKS